ncbi:O-antigen ligase family protein [Micromonospora narathiwatensis]|uniref:O-Antigen ligase n=1 Tax=Micromonospora narathiwatensis TaxID=299146 RepID=A0A1A9AG72_9ACTN|nr:O-antigen ligase family protein [Micromonospora narathiwatensis]SBT55144.1 O-Antigen ligase [Micromonospora narathiwatensis]
MLALALPLLVLRLPVTGIALVAVLAQEIKPNGRFGELTTLGHQVFISSGKIPLALPLALAAVLAAAARSWPPARPRLRSAGGVLLGVAAALVVLSVVSGLVHGQSPFSAVNQNARPFVLLLLGLIIGMSLRLLQDDRKSLEVTVGAALCVLLAAAAIAIPLGEIADDRLSDYFVYYDSALPAIAAAVFIGVLGDDRWRWDWRHLSVVAAAPLLVLISFRRSVWLAALAAFVVVLVLTWQRWKRVARQLAFVVPALAVIVFAAPGFAADLGLRSAGSFELSSSPSGTPSPSSTPTVSTAPSPSDTPSASTTPTASTTPSANSGPVASGTPTASSTPSANNAPTASSTPSASSGQDGPSSPPTKAAPTQRTQESIKHQAESTTGHLSDLRLGWEYVQANPWTGVGPQSPQLPGLAAGDSTRVYVHNELLQDWLRYGPLAPVLVILFLVAAGLAALKAVRDPDSDVVVRSAAAFCLIAPLCLMTAPFLAETSRWPLVVGIAAGIVAPFLLPRGRPDRGTGIGSPSEVIDKAA